MASVQRSGHLHKHIIEMLYDKRMNDVDKATISVGQNATSVFCIWGTFKISLHSRRPTPKVLL
jgi:hypothetical protein